MVSYCDFWSVVVVRRQQLLQRTFPHQLLAGFGPNLAGMILIWSSIIIVQKVPVRCIFTNLKFNTDSESANQCGITYIIYE